MDISQLNKEQIANLKQAYLMQHNEEVGKGISYEELANADNLISDEIIYEAYAGYNFSEDDFS